ncbi:YraN family protein [Candidatus Uhrbacteria bacterium]|nr:YraN family protein [Candidatus Uhrbacteria bacterium]MBD3284453.1 YraN family protein [Candidatus Uhrbacteria bacterium]
MASQEKEVGDHRRSLGTRGEQYAADFFVERGYQILDRNWRCREGEIDLVIRRGEELRFVEVKTRASERAGFPEESVTQEKLEHLEAVMASYLASTSQEVEVHLDVLAILIAPNGAFTVDYLEDVDAAV